MRGIQREREGYRERGIQRERKGNTERERGRYNEREGGKQRQTEKEKEIWGKRVIYGEGVVKRITWGAGGNDEYFPLV